MIRAAGRKFGGAAPICLLAVLLFSSEARGGWSPAMEGGGHLKVRGELSRPEENSLAAAGTTQTSQDGSGEFRLLNLLSWQQGISLETHYEIVAVAGDTRRRARELTLLFPGLLPEGVFLGQVVEDDRRLFDLTHVFHQGEDSIAYHRLDRLALTLTRDWGTFRAGRQAVTWGNGLLFNPMDLFNPFAPTEIERDYKLGDDLLWVELPMEKGGNLQLLYVPRRETTGGALEWGRSSLAGKLHLTAGSTEFDVLAAYHYDAPVLGLGTVGYLGGAAWRLDATWSRTADERPGDDFLALVANLDYSWIWWGKNVYGFLEVYYNGLGRAAGDYPAALLDPELVGRLERGELFTVGRTYLSGNLQFELHPLVNLHLTAIANLQDPSGVLQPRLTWDAGQNVRLLAGANLLYGSRGSEFGGFAVPGTSFTSRAADSLYLWVSWYF